MRNLYLFLVPITLILIGILLHIFFTKSLIFEEGYIIGVILSLFLFSIFNSTFKFNLSVFKNNKKILTSIALLLAAIGGVIWFVGEYLEFTGRKSKLFSGKLDDVIGSGVVLISAILVLIVHFSK